MKRPSNCGDVAIQCTIGGRYRFADDALRRVRIRVDVEDSPCTPPRGRAAGDERHVSFFIELVSDE